MVGFGNVNWYGAQHSYGYASRVGAANANTMRNSLLVQRVSPIVPVTSATSSRTIWGDLPQGMAAAQASAPAQKSNEIPFLRQGADPVEMAVRMRIQYPQEEEKSALAGQASETEKAGQTDKAAESSPSKEVDAGECQTCKERKYQDGSNDPGVSFKTPGKIAPEVAASVVRGHEMEHVSREQAKAQREDRKVVSQSVALHSAICPECGKVYVIGGTTRTVTKADNRAELFQQYQQGAAGSTFEATA